jgi:hypothetical protein
LKVAILAPADGDEVPGGKPIEFRGDVGDLDPEGLPEEGFIWSYGDGIFGTGRSLEATLPPGVHRVTLSVETEAGLGEASVTVTVDDGTGAGSWLRCDATGDGGVDISDAIGILNYLFTGSLKPGERTTIWSIC